MPDVGIADLVVFYQLLGVEQRGWAGTVVLTVGDWECGLADVRIRANYGGLRRCMVRNGGESAQYAVLSTPNPASAMACWISSVDSSRPCSTVTV